MFFYCYLSVILVGLQAFAQADNLLDGVWCSQEAGSMIQWEFQQQATPLSKDQFCILLKTTKNEHGVAVGRGLSRYVKSDVTPDHASAYREKDIYYDATVFAFSPHHGGYRLMMVDVTDRSTFDLMIGPNDSLQGFVVEQGSMQKSKSRNAYAGHVRYVKSGKLPEDFDALWDKANEITH